MSMQEADSQPADNLQALAAALSKPPDVLQLNRFLSAVAKAELEPLAEQQLLDAAKASSGAKIAALREQLKLLKARQADAPPGIGRAEDIEDGWERNAAGAKLPNEANVMRALKCSGISVSYTTLADQYKIEGLENYGPILSSHAIDETYLLLQREYKLKPTKQDFDRILLAQARRARFNPLLAYLNGLEWDGVDRLAEWLPTYTGADASEYCKEVGRLVLIAACRRAREPGVKFDTLMVWEGAQGTFKSTGVRILCPDPEWYSESLSLSAEEKEVIEQTEGKWIVEISELSGLRKKDVEHVKAFLSRTKDSARRAYGQWREDRPRQFICIATTNEAQYLQDETGHRRFWPIRIKRVDIEALARDRDQLWAEADYYARQRVDIHLPDELGDDAKQQQDLRAMVDEWEGIVADWLGKLMDKPRQEDRAVHRATMSEMASSALKIEDAKLDKHTQNRLAHCMRKAGWVKGKPSNGKNYWEPTPEAYTSRAAALAAALAENRYAARGLL